MNLTPSTDHRRSGMMATILMVAVIGLLATLTIINAGTVRRARRERQLLESRQQQQWQRVIPAPAALHSPNPPPVYVRS